MGTHPIFESDFDCLTGCMSFEYAEQLPNSMDTKSSSSDMSEHSGVQSPTISSIDSNSSSHQSASVADNNTMMTVTMASHEKIKKDLEEALQKIIKLEELLKQKDERIKLLEEEHARHQIICNPELTSALYGGRRRNAPRRNKRSARTTASSSPTTTSTPSPQPPVETLPPSPPKVESSSSTTTTTTSPPQQQPHVVVEPLNSDSFKELKNEIKRTHRRARPFDVINEPPPKTTIECSIGTFTTQQPYYRSLYVAHDEYDAEQFGPAITKKPLIPRWRVKEVSSSSDEDEKMESDEEYARRHHKYELEEKRLIKKDALVKESRMKRQEQFKTFHPDPRQFHSIEVTPELPITLWGQTLPNIRNSTFSLPWFTTTDKVNNKAK